MIQNKNKSFAIAALNCCYLIQLLQTSESRCGRCHLPGKTVFVQIGVQFDWSQVDFKDGRPAFDVRWT